VYFVTSIKVYNENFSIEITVTCGVILMKAMDSDSYRVLCIISNEIFVIVKWLGCTEHIDVKHTQTYSAYLYIHSPVMWFCSNSRGIHSIIFILRSRAVLRCSSSIINFSSVAVFWSAAAIASLNRIQSLPTVINYAMWLWKVKTVVEKLAPYGTEGWSDVSANFKCMWQKSKIRPDQICKLCLV